MIPRRDSPLKVRDPLSIEGVQSKGIRPKEIQPRGGQSVFSVYWDALFWDVFFLPCSSETLTTIPNEMTAIPMICLMVMFS